MADLTNVIPSISKEYLFIKGIKAFEDTSEDAADPTSLAVEIAIMPHSVKPDESTTWLSAEWEPDTTDSVRLLLSPTAQDLDPRKTYDVWLHILGAVEEPKRKVGSIKVT